MILSSRVCVCECMPSSTHTHTFIQPIGEPVEDDALHPGGSDSQGVAPHVRLVVDVVLKNVDLIGKIKGSAHVNANAGTHSHTQTPHNLILSIRDWYLAFFPGAFVMLYFLTCLFSFFDFL